MPLLPGKDEIGHNISEMEKSGHKHDQAVAAALREAGVPKKNAKITDDGPDEIDRAVCE
jgi:hypothetical protein